MTLRDANPAELAEWDRLIAAQPGGGEVWQSREYAEAKRFHGYRDRYLVGDGFPATLVLEKRVPLLGALWYVPAGPAGADTAEVLANARRLADFARQAGAFLLKVETRLLRSDETRAAFVAAGFAPTFRILPNESTILLDLSGDEAAVMGRFSSSTRTKIRKADKIGFSVRRVDATEEHCRTMFGLLQQTSDEKFTLRPYEYYRAFWQAFAATGRGQLVLGYTEDGTAVSGMFGIVLGDTSCYKDGASAREGLPNGAMNRMQWELILWARERGATVHDLCGAPPSERIDDREHPLYGVGQYKVRFNKEVTDYAGTYDLALKPGAAKLWAAVGDRIARRWSLAVKHDPYY